VGIRNAMMQLTVSADGNTLSGTFHNGTTNTEDPFSLTRQSNTCN